MSNTRRIRRLREEAVARQKGLCFYCRSLMGPPPVPFSKASGLAATFEHKDPRAKGGRAIRHNGVAACYTCNNRKGAMTAEEFLASPALARIVRGRCWPSRRVQEQVQSRPIDLGAGP